MELYFCPLNFQLLYRAATFLFQHTVVLTRSTAKTPAAKMPAAVVIGANFGIGHALAPILVKHTSDALAKVNKQTVENQ